MIAGETVFLSGEQERNNLKNEDGGLTQGRLPLFFYQASVLSPFFPFSILLWNRSSFPSNHAKCFFSLLFQLSSSAHIPSSSSPPILFHPKFPRSLSSIHELIFLLSFLLPQNSLPSSPPHHFLLRSCVLRLAFEGVRRTIEVYRIPFYFLCPWTSSSLVICKCKFVDKQSRNHEVNVGRPQTTMTTGRPRSLRPKAILKCHIIHWSQTEFISHHLSSSIVERSYD